MGIDNEIEIDENGQPAPASPESQKEKVMERDHPETDLDQSAFVNRWLADIKASKKHFDAEFTRMRKDMKFAKGLQWSDAQADNDSKYTVNLVQRHIQQRVSSLYAKNPRVVAKRRPRLEHELWDGDIESLQMAMMQISQATQAGQMPPPEAIQLMEEVSAVKAKTKLYDKIGKTAEILYTYYMDAQEPNFKIQAKQLIRRTVTTSIGYVKLGFNRSMERSPEMNKRIADLGARLAVAKQLSADVADGLIEENSAEHEELEQTLAILQSQKDVIISEGLSFSFPKSTAIIPDPSTIHIKGWVGCGWLAEEFFFTSDEIKQIYEIDVGSSAKSYDAGKVEPSSSSRPTATDKKKSKHAVYEVQCKTTGMVFTICDGFPSYLSPPTPPKVLIPRFYNIYSLSFNDIEDEESIFPQSDVSLLRPMQLEYNRSREGLREHRIANRPAYVAAAGILEDADKAKISSHDSSEVIELNIGREVPIVNIIQPLGKIPIDAAVYDTSPLFDDIMKVVGAQEANFGGTSSSSATEVSVAEGARMSTIGSNVDDLDDLLCELAEDGSRIMFQHVSVETAKKIVGAGAVWAEMSAQDVADNIYLEVKAGSSGRPNKAQDIANFERMAPTLMQIGGIKPLWLAKQALMRLDDSLDLDEALLEGLPSMIAQNGMMQASTGDPSSDPNQQGNRGTSKAKDPRANAGNMASHPAPNDVQTGQAGGR